MSRPIPLYNRQQDCELLGRSSPPCQSFHNQLQVDLNRSFANFGKRIKTVNEQPDTGLVAHAPNNLLTTSFITSNQKNKKLCTLPISDKNTRCNTLQTNKIRDCYQSLKTNTLPDIAVKMTTLYSGPFAMQLADLYRQGGKSWREMKEDLNKAGLPIF